MVDHVVEHLKALYGVHPDMPPTAFQFPRLPPGIQHPMFRIYQDSSKERLASGAGLNGNRLQAFQQLYHRHASGLLSKSSGIIPPGHPMYSEHDSVEALRAQNDKLLKENTDLRKKLERQVK